MQTATATVRRRRAEADAPLPAASAASPFSQVEVEAHNRPTDCWLIVRGRVYNVTDWVPKHPGGDFIFIKAGKDCTQLFDAYHPLSARQVLAKYYIGDVAVSEDDASRVITYGEDTEEGQFYFCLRQRVDSYFRDRKINPRTSVSFQAKAAFILLCLAGFYYSTFFAFTTLLPALACAVGLGVSVAEVGICIMHDANHGAGAASRPWRYFLSALLDGVGASSFMWRQQHVVGHHAYTNVAGADPDIRVNDPDIRCVHAGQPRHPYHAGSLKRGASTAQAWQHVYLGALYGLLVLKSVVVDDFAALTSGAIGPVAIPIMTRRETAVFWGGKAAYAVLGVALPAMRSRLAWPALAAAWLAAQLVAGWMLALLFQVAHVTGEVEFLAADRHGRVLRGWAAAQVATSADFAHGSWWWTHLSGGLNYQVVHHLFPGICHTHYPAITPIVVATCAEFGVPYKVFPSFWAALAAHFAHLKAVGIATQALPSLATIG